MQMLSYRGTNWTILFEVAYTAISEYDRIISKLVPNLEKFCLHKHKTFTQILHSDFVNLNMTCHQKVCISSDGASQIKSWVTNRDHWWCDAFTKQSMCVCTLASIQKKHINRISTKQNKTLGLTKTFTCSPLISTIAF